MGKCIHLGKNQNSLWRNLRPTKLKRLRFCKLHFNGKKEGQSITQEKLNFSSGKVDKINPGVITSDTLWKERTPLMTRPYK